MAVLHYRISDRGQVIIWDANSITINRHNSEYLRLRGLTIRIKVALNAIFSMIRKFDISQMNLVELIFLLVKKNEYFTLLIEIITRN